MLNFQSKQALLIPVFLSFVMISGTDLALAISEGTYFAHVAQEAVILTLSLMGLAVTLFLPGLSKMHFNADKKP